jgi:hypothetical protein
MAWRTPFTVLACISILFSVATFLWLTESPRWFTFHNRPDDAARAWDHLEVSMTDREELAGGKVDIYMEALTHPLAPTGSIVAPTTFDQVVSRRSQQSCQKGRDEVTLLDAFKPDVRSRTLLGLFLMGMQQLAGIDGVLYVRFFPHSLPSIPHKRIS